MPLSRIANISEDFVGKPLGERLKGYGETKEQFVVVDPAGTAFSGRDVPLDEGVGGFSKLLANAVYSKKKEDSTPSIKDKQGIHYGRPINEKGEAKVDLTPGEAVFNNTLADSKKTGENPLFIIHAKGPTYNKSNKSAPDDEKAVEAFQKSLTTTLTNTLLEWQKNDTTKDKKISLPLVSSEIFGGKNMLNNRYYDVYLNALDDAMIALNQDMTSKGVSSAKSAEVLAKVIITPYEREDFNALEAAMTRFETSKGQDNTTARTAPSVNAKTLPAKTTTSTLAAAEVSTPTPSSTPTEAEKERAIAELKGKTDVVANMSRMQDAAYDVTMKIDPKRKELAEQAFGLIGSLHYEKSEFGGSLTGFTNLQNYLQQDNVASLAKTDKSFGIFHDLISRSFDPSIAHSDAAAFAKASVEHFDFLKADPIETSGKQDVTNLGNALKNLAANNATVSNPTFSALVSTSSQQIYEELSSKALELAKAELAKAEAESAKAGGAAPSETTKPESSRKKEVSQETKDRVELAKKTVIGITSITAMGIASAFFPPIGVLLIAGAAAYLMNRNKDNGKKTPEADDDLDQDHSTAAEHAKEARARAENMRSTIAEKSKSQTDNHKKGGGVAEPAARSSKALEEVTEAAKATLGEAEKALEEAEKALGEAKRSYSDVTVNDRSSSTYVNLTTGDLASYATSPKSPPTLYDNEIRDPAHPHDKAVPSGESDDHTYESIDDHYESIDYPSASNPIYGANSGESVVDDDEHSLAEGTYLTGSPQENQYDKLIKVVTEKDGTDTNKSSVTDRSDKHMYSHLVIGKHTSRFIENQTYSSNTTLAPSNPTGTAR